LGGDLASISASAAAVDLIRAVGDVGNAARTMRGLQLEPGDREIVSEPFAGRACRTLFVPDQFERDGLLAFIELERRRDKGRCKGGMREDVIGDEGPSNTPSLSLRVQRRRVL
jgi:hypothetical protein